MYQEGIKERRAVDQEMIVSFNLRSIRITYDISQTDAGWPSQCPSYIAIERLVHRSPWRPCRWVFAPLRSVRGVSGVLQANQIVILRGRNVSATVCQPTISVCRGPMPGGQHEHLIVVFVLRGHDRVLGIIGLSGRKQGLQGEQHRSQGHCGRPILFQYV